MKYSFVQIPVFLQDGTNNQEYLLVLNDYSKLTQQSGNPRFIGGMPVTLENNCFKELLREDSNGNFAYYLTLKVDGERYLFFLSSWGELYFIDRLLNFFIFVNESGERIPRITMPPFLIDGELLFHKDSFEYLIFDLLYYSGNDYLASDYYIRYALINNLIEVLTGYSKSFSSNLRFTVKQWFSILDITKSTNIYSYIINETNKNRNIKLKADGLILQPFDTPYVPYTPWDRYNNVQFKWKPLEDQTVDLRIKILSDSRWELILKSGFPFTMPGSGMVATYKPTRADKDSFVDGDVAEFKYSNNEFKLLKARQNKEPNSLGSVMSVWNFIQNPFTLDLLSTPLKVLSTSTSTTSDFKKVLNSISKSQLILFATIKSGIFFSKYEIGRIKSIYSQFVEPEDELECRIFKNGKKTLSVDKFTFHYLWTSLIKNFEMKNIQTIDIYETDSGSKSRSTYSTIEDINSGTSIINETKKQKESFIEKPKNKKMYNDLLFKLSLSTETKTTKIIKLKRITKEKPTGHNNLIRFKNRYSFQISDLWIIDLTVVKTGYSIENTGSSNDTYEIEIEYIGTKIPFGHFIKSFSNVYTFILGNTGYC
jgi:hypothetical protein